MIVDTGRRASARAHGLVFLKPATAADANRRISLRRLAYRKSAAYARAELDMLASYSW